MIYSKAIAVTAAVYRGLFYAGADDFLVSWQLPFLVALDTCHSRKFEG